MKQEGHQSSTYRTESCVETLEQAKLAEQHGAHQLELCASLELDGLSPPDSLIADVLAAVSIPVKVMLRHRPGSFVYSSGDVRELLDDLKRLSQHDVAGVVFGATARGDLDYDLIKQIAHLSRVPVTVHKAIDEVSDIRRAVERLCHISGIGSILSSGGQLTALDGADELRDMVEIASGRLDIIAAGKITAANRDKVYQLTSAPVLHGKKIVG